LIGGRGSAEDYFGYLHVDRQILQPLEMLLKRSVGCSSQQETTRNQ